MNEAQAVWDWTVGKDSLTPLCGAVFCSSELELFVCMLVGVRRHIR